MSHEIRLTGVKECRKLYNRKKKQAVSETYYD